MNDIDPQAAAQLLNALLQPWHDAVNDPAKAQQEVLHEPLARLCPDRITANSMAQPGQDASTTIGAPFR